MCPKVIKRDIKCHAYDPKLHSKHGRYKVLCYGTTQEGFIYLRAEKDGLLAIPKNQILDALCKPKPDLENSDS